MMNVSTLAPITTGPKWTPIATEPCSCSAHSAHEPVDSFEWSGVESAIHDPLMEERRTALGKEVWQKYQEGQIDLLPVQVSGRNDGADARSNIVDTSVGRQAKRSSYGSAPGGRVSLSIALLDGLKQLSEDFAFRVTSLAGGSHSSRSRHYLGVGLDVDTIDGRRVDKNHPRFREFMAQARELGATEVLGPGASGHDHHLHIAWPRDATTLMA